MPALGQALTRTIYVSLDPHQLYYSARAHWAHRRAPPRAHRLSGHREPDGRICGRRLRIQHNGWTEYALMGEGMGLAPGLHGPA